ncbi:methyl-accepting chemotaxis protein [Geobacter argillaceus]|uniref:Methyl-accepting chemotaxis sensory transducer n=1 Tax=Geobacter argillaceus TaxID=345631 RepID=A0A562WST9_9BACT|nr:methyl-accepting chemotaxis protein [Geobacter argillaceus]TWJ33361.1 methyl-accepting chemotaxis sensory transducer [Geobacter argillaceus]
MLANVKIGKRLAIGFGIILLFLVAIAITGYWGTHALEKESRRILYTEAKLVEYAQRTRANVNIMRRFEKDAFINLSDPAKVGEYRKKWGEALEQCKKRVDGIDGLLTDQQDKAVVAAIRKELETYVAGFNLVADQVVAGQIRTTQDANSAIGEYKEPIHRMESQAEDLANRIDKRMASSSKDAEAIKQKINGVLTTLSLAAILLALLVVVTLIRSIKRPLLQINAMLTDIAQGEGDLTKRLDYAGRDELGEICAMFNTFVEKLRTIISQVAQNSALVASAANQLQAASVQTSNGAEEVAAQAGTVATAAEEMAATSGDIAQNCHLAADGSRHANDSANAGASVVEKTVAVMNQIAVKVQESAKTVESLGNRSDQIGAIIGTIEDIADQTNLLALNAAIEAARAGEQGRGFAVVADEVRALAERTTKATREIGEMIKAIQTETKGAVAVMEEGVHQVENGTSEAAKSGAALQEILDQVNSVSMQVNQIATAAEQQTATSSEISGNIQQITEVIQHTARGAEESASAASQLASTAEELQRLVGQFKLA